MNKNFFSTLASLLLIITGYSQSNSSLDICTEVDSASYFPTEIACKKITWNDTYYTETMIGKTNLDGKEYIIYEQKWKGSSSNELLIREKKGVVYQYDGNGSETIRYSPNFEKGHTCKTSDDTYIYNLKTFKGKLKTPFCKYKNLMILETSVELMIGDKIEYGHYNFYYQKGIGYVGATQSGKLISYIQN